MSCYSLSENKVLRRIFAPKREVDRGTEDLDDEAYN
jgi:hypothetical protein